MDYPIPYKGKDPFVFISYSHRNSDQVLRIIELLQENKFRVWYDNGINPGAEWDDDIANHVTECTWFVAFISKEYLESDNCRDELFYARKLSKRRLLIYLEDIELPAAMDMRMNRLQAIFWNHYQTENDAMEKFLETEEIELCQDLTALEAEQKAAQEAARQKHEQEKAETEDSIQEPETVSDNVPAEPVQKEPAYTAVPVAAAESDKKKPKRTPKKGGKLRTAMIAVAAVIAAVFVVIIAGTGIMMAGSKTSSSGAENNVAAAVDSAAEQTAAPAEQETAAAEQDAASAEETAAAADDMSSLLWGCHKCTGAVSAYVQDSRTTFQQLEMPSGDLYEMTVLPIQITAAPDYPGYLVISFADRYNEIYSFYGAYTLEGTAFTVTPGEPEDLDGALTCWDEQDAAPLKAELTYEFELHNGVYIISTDDCSVSLNILSETTRSVVVLSGSASDPNHMYQDIEAIEVTLNYGYDVENFTPTIKLADGGQTTDAVVSQLWSSIGAVSLEWHTESRPYNGRTEDFEVNRTENFDYYSTAPYGFVIVDKGEIYYYQNESDIEDTSTTTDIDTPEVGTYEIN